MSLPVKPLLIGGALIVAGTAGVFLFSGDPLRSAVQAMVNSEEALLRVSQQLSRFKFGVGNLTLPDEASLGLFADRVSVTDITGPKDAVLTVSPGVVVRDWSIGVSRQVDRGSLTLWQPLFKTMRYSGDAKFKIVRGHWTGDDSWQCELAFKGNGRSAAGFAAISTKQQVTWRASTRNDGEDWEITAWHTKKLRTYEVAAPLFREVLDAAVPAAQQLVTARNSLHSRQLIKHLQTKDLQLKEAQKGLQAGPMPSWKPHPTWTSDSFDRHPCVTVCDYNRDGHDDLFVGVRWGKCMLFRNLGNGTFADVAASVGLAIDSKVSCALFADFDNDGDDDAFIGRTLSPSCYYSNEGGRFVARPKALPAPLLLASSASAADYDGDGLLDLYVTTYATQMLNMGTSLKEGMNSADFATMTRLSEGLTPQDRPWDAYGPPNELLRNAGEGRFVSQRNTPSGSLFRNTYQATWADYDGDGDADLYCANDYSPNNLYRNDGGKLTDVTAETGTSDIGFGMGASWGDFDGDGRQDLYVSNMYSKAGRRITEQIPGLDPRIRRMAMGNSLFHNTEAGFKKVSGTKPPEMLVEAAGWAWSGQFLDVENDGNLDLVCVSGYYTPPPGLGTVPFDY